MKYIIELEQIEGTELYKAKGCNTLVFDRNGIDKILKPLDDKEIRADIAKECAYLLNCGMGKIKALNHLIKILGAEETKECPFKKGELVEVSDCGRLWSIRYFSHIATDNEFKYRVFLDNYEKGNEGWKYCRKYGTLGKENKQ